eukprot:10894090-Karenia_brevis.AAC.1
MMNIMQRAVKLSLANSHRVRELSAISIPNCRVKASSNFVVEGRLATQKYEQTFQKMKEKKIVEHTKM